MALCENPKSLLITPAGVVNSFDALHFFGMPGRCPGLHGIGETAPGSEIGPWL